MAAVDVLTGLGSTGVVGPTYSHPAGQALSVIVHTGVLASVANTSLHPTGHTN